MKKKILEEYTALEWENIQDVETKWYDFDEGDQQNPNVKFEDAFDASFLGDVQARVANLQKGSGQTWR